MTNLQREIIENHRRSEERIALHRRYGYDSEASIAFVLTKALPLSERVLEVGTGKGRFLTALAKHVAHVTTLDIDAAEQRLARLHARYEGLHRKIEFVTHDAEDLPWPDACFDAVVSMNTFHHLKRPYRVLGEMLRVVKPSGKIMLSDLSPRGFQIFDRIHRAEGRIHPRPQVGLAGFRDALHQQGCATKYYKGCNQEVLVATRDLAAGSFPATEGTRAGH